MKRKRPMSSAGEVFTEEVDPKTIQWLKDEINGCVPIPVEEIVSFEEFTYYISECSDHAQVWWVEVDTSIERWHFEVVQYANDTVSVKEI
jgi:hypothetical protein